MSEPIRKTEARLTARELRRKKHEQQARLWKTVPLLVVGILALIGAGLVAYGTFSRSSDVQGVAGPRLQLDRDQIDMGDQHFNTTVRAMFRITNTGDGTLKLDAPKVASVVEGC